MSRNDADPVVGSSVHYYVGMQCRAALVTEVPVAEGAVDQVALVVFPPAGPPLFLPGVARDETWGDDGEAAFTDSTWHWAGA
jgi:hypothetical protein